MCVKSRSECEHGMRKVIYSSSHEWSDERLGSGHSEVTLCTSCGEFRVTGKQNGQPFDIRFVLVSEESVHAAGAYLRRLASDELDRKHQAK